MRLACIQIEQERIRRPRTASGSIRRGRGFTLIELVATVSVAAILATLAAGSFSSAHERRQLITVAETVNAELQLARLKALQRNEGVTVSWAAGADWCYGIDPGPCDCTVAGDCAIKTAHDSGLASRITLAGADFSGATTLAFERVRGTASAAGGVDFQNPGGLGLRVEVTTAGRTRICSPSDNTPGYPSC
jgi:type IV fimbrial biogenesis protein FimT